MENTTTPTKASFKTNHKDIHQQVTDTIIAQLEKGVIPWQKSWTGPEGTLPSLPFNFTTGNRYRGINILLLWSAAIERNYTSSEWASFKQWQAKGAAIRKGEKGNLIVYYDTFEREDEGEIKKIPFLKSSVVFNRTQLVSYEPPAPSEQPKTKHDFEQLLIVDLFIQGTGAIVKYHHGGAYYDRAADDITVPFTEDFVATETCTPEENYTGVLMHELVHWSGAPHRLNRTKGKQFGDSNYAIEELTAELGAAFLTAGFGMRTAEKGNHAAYIDHWLKVLKEDKHFLLTSASEASKAVDYLYSLQPQ